MRLHIHNTATALIAIAAWHGVPACSQAYGDELGSSRATAEAIDPADVSIPAAPSQGNMIVVTATKRPETILEVPLAVSVIGAEELDCKNATSFADYLPGIPGVQFNPAGNVFGNLFRSAA